MEPSELPPAVILAGGLATRLHPITQSIPKALVEVAGQPFLHHQLELLKSRGISKAVLCVGHLGHMIRDRFGDEACGVRLRYSFDGDRLLGTGGALRKALPLLPESFFVLYGDSYLPCGYREVATAFEASGKPALMTVYRNQGRYDSSNVEYGAGRILRYDKRNPSTAMNHIDYGLGMFRRTIFAALPIDEPRDLAEIYRQLLHAGMLAAFEVPERFYEIGSMEGLRETAAFLERRT